MHCDLFFSEQLHRKSNNREKLFDEYSAKILQKFKAPPKWNLIYSFLLEPRKQKLGGGHDVTTWDPG